MKPTRPNQITFAAGVGIYRTA